MLKSVCPSDDGKLKWGVRRRYASNDCNTLHTTAQKKSTG